MPDDTDAFAPDAAGLHAAVERVVSALSGTAGTPLPPAEELKLPEGLPEAGVGGDTALDQLAPAALSGAAKLGDPGYLAHMDPPTPWVTWVTAMWAASVNQNLLHPETAPSARPLEERVVAWLAPYFGMTGGHMVPGSTLANLTALWAARDTAGATEVVCSTEAHVSVRKAAHLLGLRLREVTVDAAHRLGPDGLGDLSRAVLVLTAGTTTAGAVDPLEAGRDAAWRHVDAAWAGPLRLSEHYAGRLAGVESADSVAVSGHKWLFQPKESALVLFADAERAHAAISSGAAYLTVPNVGVLGSHGAAALPLAATLLAWGRAGVAARVERCMTLADTLAGLARDDQRLELFREPSAGIVLWRPRGADADAVRGRLRRSFVSAADAGGRRWLRSVAANPAADPRLVVQDVLDACDSLAAAATARARGR